MKELPTWVLTALGAVVVGAFGILVKEVFTIWVRKRAERFWDKQMKAAGPASPPGPPPAVFQPLAQLPGPVPVAADVQLLAKDVELMHMRQTVADAQNGCRILREKLDRLELEQLTARQMSDQNDQLKQMVIGTQNDLRRLRQKADEFEVEIARLHSELTEERGRGQLLKRENERLRMEGGDVPRPRVRPVEAVPREYAVERVKTIPKPRS